MFRILSFVCALAAAPLWAAGHVKISDAQKAVISTYYMEQFAYIASEPHLKDALDLRAQNPHDPSRDAVLALEEQWAAELEVKSGDLLTAITQNPTASAFNAQVLDAGGLIADIFLLDPDGYAAAASLPTHHYSFSRDPLYRTIANAEEPTLYVSDLEYNPITHVNEVVVAQPVVEDGTLIGVLAVAMIADILLVD